MTQNLNSVFNEFENTIQRSQRIASQTNHINRLQTKELGLFDQLYEETENIQCF